MSFFQITFELANQRLKLFSLGQGPFGEFSIAYSELLQVILNSLILAAVMFAVFRFVRSLIKRKSEKSEPTIETPSNVVVLQDWRDAIRKNGKVAEIIA